MKRLLIVSDGGVPTGFARVNENLVRRLQGRWDIAVLGINYQGDPHDWPCRLYPAIIGGDPFGYGRFQKIVEMEEPHVVLIHSDPWIVMKFLEIRRIMGDKCPPVAAYMPVDAPGMQAKTAETLNKLDLAVWYTEFGRQESQGAGFVGSDLVIPLGVNLDLYQPMDRRKAREVTFARWTDPVVDRYGNVTTPAKIAEWICPPEAYIVGNVNRNHIRKRLDLSIRYFAEWVKQYDRRDAYLYLHCAVRDSGWNLQHLAKYYGLGPRVLLTDISPRYGIAEADMRAVYGGMDVQISTTLGEGFGLPTLEAAACGIPQIVPEYSALAEWARGAVRFVPVTSTLSHTGYDSNCVGGVADERAFVEALEEMYQDTQLRAELGEAGRALARQRRFQWDVIADQFDAALASIATQESQDEAAA